MKGGFWIFLAGVAVGTAATLLLNEEWREKLGKTGSDIKESAREKALEKLNQLEKALQKDAQQ